MYKILKNWLSTEGSGLYFFFKRGLPFTFTSHCFIGAYKPLPGNAAIFPWAWGVGCSSTTVLLDLAYCQSPHLYRTNNVSQKLAAKLDRELFSHFVRLLEIFTNHLCFTLSENTECSKLFMKAAYERLTAWWSGQWLVWTAAELPGHPCTHHPCDCPDIKATNTSVRDFFLSFFLSYCLHFDRKKKKNHPQMHFLPFFLEDFSWEIPNWLCVFRLGMTGWNLYCH